jgi:hypothetical protein
MKQIMKRQMTAVSTAVLWEWRKTSWRERSDNNHLWSAKWLQWARQYRGNGGQPAEEREATIITYEAPNDRSEHGSIVGMEENKLKREKQQ